jgi:A/G-specific adenine glycosylase
MSSNKISKDILCWYDDNKTEMPWRDEADPYKVWLSEIMLQQTQVTTVIDYYYRWIEKFPTISDVASASVDEILKYWEGLGYYSRARNFHASCKEIDREGGSVPKGMKEFQNLKGVGPYIAAAVQSISFNEPVSVVDGNVNRVASRFNAYKTPANKNQKAIKIFMDSILDVDRPGDFNQAVMDLGRYICKPRNPLCGECPISLSCIANQKSDQHLYPTKVKSKPIPHYDVAVGIISDGSRLLITKRKEDGLLGGLWEFPGGKMKHNENPMNAIKREIKEELSIKIKTKDIIAQVEHRYSHFSVSIRAIHCLYDGGDVKLNGPTAYKWINPNSLSQYAFPKASIKLFKSIEGIT